MSVETINEKAATEYFDRGRKSEQSGDTDKAVEYYDRALNEDPDHDQACFRLARLYDQHGMDSQAIELYERVCSGDPVPLTALVNLAVLYEDAGLYEEARRCLKAVLATDPNHPRARLFLRDVDSAHDPRVEEEQRAAAERDAVLDLPVYEFDLSVRARNALKKANIETIGDLLRVREQELMAFKNFGETSLSEIKALLAERGLRLGQFVEEGEPGITLGGDGPAAGFAAAPGNDPIAGGGAAEPQELPGELMESGIGDLDLSVRSRKALQRLNIQTVGELTSKSEEELLGCKNFGQTSLNEIKQILASFGLTLRRDG
jgi:DNA-directed RNA polymerase subunit alpha